jgi:TetR/AcrR family transcriptional regulator, cholesterol catabolism regulator
MTAAQALTGQDHVRLTRRERQRETTRQRILDSALSLFRERGYADTSVDQIADRADVARRTLFNHFARKQDVLAAWASERRDRLSALLLEDQASASTAPAAIRRQFAMLAEENEEDVTLAAVLVQGWLAEVSELHETFPVFASFRTAIALGQQRGEFHDRIDAEIAAEMLTVCYTDTLGRWVQPQASGGPPPFSLAQVLLAKAEIVIQGMAGKAHARLCDVKRPGQTPNRTPAWMSAITIRGPSIAVTASLSATVRSPIDRTRTAGTPYPRASAS